jgi:Fe-S-cluster-containing hydrogenase component 2
MAINVDAYRKLQEHLDKMPVGYPATKSGIEINILKTIFTEEEANVATYLDYKHKSVNKIFEDLKGEVGNLEILTQILDGIVAKGGISRITRDGQSQYAVLPLVLWGMYEQQLKRLSPDFLQNFGQYFQGEFMNEFATSKVPRMRVIPIEESIKIEHHVATYDELQQLIEQAGEHIAMQECICRKVMDLQGKNCQITNRREVCMSLGDLADLYIKEGWGRQVTQEEALTLAKKSVDEGLVLMPGNQQEAEFICACCSDCCGMLSALKYHPRPVDFVASNFFAKVDPELCTGLGTCVDRCPMEAVKMEDGIASVNMARCIGCGLCVPTCAEDAIFLVKKEPEMIPPQTEDDFFDLILADKTAVQSAQ